jgi:hypothetical protein
MDKKKKKIYISIIIVLILLIVLVSITLSIQQKAEKEKFSSTENISYDEVEKTIMTEKLSKMKERDRMEYYITTFLNYAEDGIYTKAYNMLYEDFKTKYFPTQLKFEEYAETHFVSMEDKDFTNIERQDNTYFIWVTITDVLNGKKDDPGVEYNFVIRENGLNDVDLSFSVKE